MADGVLYYLNLNSKMHSRVRSRSPLTFIQSSIYLTAVNNSFQPLTFFCHEEFHLRCCIGLELNIVTYSTKILKGIGGTPYLMIECNLGKIWKTHPLRCSKNTLPEVLRIKLLNLVFGQASARSYKLVIMLLVIIGWLAAEFSRKRLQAFFWFFAWS